MHHQHRSRRTALGGVAVALALAAGGAPAPAAAEEAGQWFGRAVLVVTSRKAARIEDRANHTASLSEMDGVVFNGDGRPFLDKARYQVVDLFDAGASMGGYKTFTDADGSKVFARYAVTAPGRPEARGTFEFTGGTGRYQGSLAAASSASRGSATPRPGTSFAASTASRPPRRPRGRARRRRPPARAEAAPTGSFRVRPAGRRGPFGTPRGRKGTGASAPVLRADKGGRSPGAAS